MSVLTFDKDSLGNLEYSLRREMLSTNRAGGYMSTTIVCCNTRKYHGLMVCPIREDEEENHVLLSSLDETVIQHDQRFNLGIHRFSGVYEPRGHKYITDFSYTPTPTITYRVGGVTLRKEMLWIHSRTQLMIRYTLLEARSDTKLLLRPFLAFRRAHEVACANMEADGRSYPIAGGVRSRLYEKYPWLHMQLNRTHEFVAAPDWYYKFEYLEEKERGYPYQEDLLTTGYFEVPIAKGESVIFSGSTEEIDPAEIEKMFNEELARRSSKIDFLSCLRHSARQFIVRRGDRTEVIAGYPWFGRWGRDTFIALPGITLTQGRVEDFRAVLNTMTCEMQSGLFPNMGNAYNSVDAPLWFFWTLQQLQFCTEDAEEIWLAYGEKMKDILSAYRRGIGGIMTHSNGLVWASSPTHALTWMDAVVEGKPVTGRDGYQVEINALWYNAMRYTMELADRFNDKAWLKEWRGEAEKTKASFVKTFWLDEGYLADYVDGKGTANWFIRPNQVIACALPYTMLNQEQMQSILSTVKRHLLVPKGLRTLSPRNPLYQGHYHGDQPTRDRQYHQGTAWPWLLEHYVKASFDLYGAAFTETAEEILADFEEVIQYYGIGSISEICDGDPPHTSRGAISQAWSVGAVLRIHDMIETYKKNKKGGKR